MIKNGIVYNDYSPWVFDVSKAEGSYIWNSKGNKLLDFTSGWNVTNLGWNRPEVVAAVITQANKNTYASMWTADPIQNELAKELINSLPKGLDAVGRATGGTEANEEALKTARAYTKRKKIVGFKDSYHGQSFGTLSIGYLPEYVTNISPLVGDFIQIDFPKLYNSKKTPDEILKDFEKTLEDLLSKEDVAAIVTEAGIITGWGSTYVAPKGYLTLVRRLTKKYGTLLILDEIGTGFSRCGKLFGMELEDVVPDIVTFAKAFSNGAAPIGAMVTTTEIAERSYKYSNLTSTFGWMPVPCAAALKTLQIHKRDKVWDKAKRDGDHFIKTLREELKNNPRIADVRGIGMEVGVQFKDPDMMGKIVHKSIENGLHLCMCDNGNIQLMPPLTILRKDLDKGIEVFVDAAKSA